MDPQDHTLRGTACRTGRFVGNRRVGLENPPTSRGAQTNYCRRNFGIPGLSATHSARRSDTDTWATSVTPASHRRIPPWGQRAPPTWSEPRVGRRDVPRTAAPRLHTRCTSEGLDKYIPLFVLLAKTRGQTQHKTTTAPRKRVETHAGPDLDVLVTLRTALLSTRHALRFDSSD